MEAVRGIAADLHKFSDTRSQDGPEKRSPQESRKGFQAQAKRLVRLIFLQLTFAFEDFLEIRHSRYFVHEGRESVHKCAPGARGE